MIKLIVYFRSTYSLLAKSYKLLKYPMTVIEERGLKKTTHYFYVNIHRCNMLGKPGEGALNVVLVKSVDGGRL